VETNNIGFLLVTIVALVTSTLTLASFVKVSQSVFFGQLPKEYENVKEVPFGMRLAMGILAVLCVVTGLFPNTVTGLLTEPAARAVADVGEYISAMGFKSNLPVPELSFAHVGVWQPINWLLILCISLLALTIAAVSGRYDRVSEQGSEETDSKYQLFYGGEKNVYSQVGGGDLFWGFKHNWRHYFSFMHDLHSGVVNDYALWAVIALALAILYLMIAI
jgi:multicomponent Na+:H+ antiporter subunit D